jgi:hypothetical protein
MAAANRFAAPALACFSRPAGPAPSHKATDAYDQTSTTSSTKLDSKPGSQLTEW